MSSQDYDSDDFCVTMDEVEEDEDLDNENGSEPEGMDEATDSDDNNLEMPQRKINKSAAVWNLAQRVEGSARCNLCEMLKIKRLKNEKKTRSRGNQPLIRNFSVKRGIMDPLKKKKLDKALVRMTICMNRPFEAIENHHFRNVLFIAEPNYIVPSRRRHTFQFDEAALKVEDEFKKDISTDVIDAGHKTINITSVIPFLDTVFADLTSLSAKMSGDGKRFVDLLSTNLKSNRRFPNGYKTTSQSF